MIIEAQTKLDEMEIKDLTNTRSQLSELEKSLDQFTTETDSLSADLEDADDKWNNAIRTTSTRSKQSKTPGLK